MPIEPEFQHFACDGRRKEEKFSLTFLVPLLNRLRLSSVSYCHGQREFGIDIVFTERDPFGNLAVHGLQAKYEDSIGQAESHALIDDCHEAFLHKVSNPITGAEAHIASFTVANAGSIAPNARSNFMADADKREHGGNVRLLDGKALLTLDRWANIAQEEHIGALQGLLVELRYNRLLLQQHCTALTAFQQSNEELFVVPPLRAGAISHYVQRPFGAGALPVREASELLGRIESLNSTLEFINGNGHPAAKGLVGKILATDFPAIEQAGETFEQQIICVMDQIGPLAAK